MNSQDGGRLSLLDPSCMSDNECFHVTEGKTRGSGKKIKKGEVQIFLISNEFLFNF